MLKFTSLHFIKKDQLRAKWLQIKEYYEIWIFIKILQFVYQWRLWILDIYEDYRILSCIKIME